MDCSQGLCRRNEFKASNTGYFVYANADKDKKAFDGLLEFEVTLIAYTGNDSWVEPAILDIKKTLDSEQLPEAAKDCDYCRYREMVGKKLMSYAKPIEKRPVAEKKTSPKFAVGDGTLG